MAIYVYKLSDGTLVSWCPNDTDPVADAATLSALGYASISGLPALGPTIAWDSTNKTTKTVTAPVQPSLIQTGKWILRFTPQEFSGIMASTDPVVQQFIYALNHTTDLDLNDPSTMQGVNYLVTANLLQSSRVAAVMASA